MQQLSEAERAYRRGALQAVQFLKGDLEEMYTRQVDVLSLIALYEQALITGRGNPDPAYLGSYLDEVRTRVRTIREEAQTTTEPLSPILCVLVEEAPIGSEIPPEVTVDLCPACGKKVYVSSSSRKLIKEGTAQLSCYPCHEKATPGTVMLGTMTPEGEAELEKFRGWRAARQPKNLTTDLPITLASE